MILIDSAISRNDHLFNTSFVFTEKKQLKSRCDTCRGLHQTIILHLENSSAALQ